MEQCVQKSEAELPMLFDTASILTKSLKNPNGSINVLIGRPKTSMVGIPSIHPVSAEYGALQNLDANRLELQNRIDFKLLFSPLLCLSDRRHEEGAQQRRGKQQSRVDVSRLAHAQWVRMQYFECLSDGIRGIATGDGIGSLSQCPCTVTHGHVDRVCDITSMLRDTECNQNIAFVRT